MRRKKSTKRPAKRSLAKNQVITSESIEKAFMAIPMQLTGLLQKEINVLKQKKLPLKNKLVKDDAKLTTVNRRIQQLTGGKKSSAKARQLASAKMATKKLNKTIATFNNELHSIDSNIEKMTNKLAKMAALKKLLASFEKEWIQNSKKQKVKTTKPSLSIIENKSSMLEQSHVDQLSHNIENNNIGQATDSTS